MTTVFRSGWLALTGPSINGPDATAATAGSYRNGTRGAHQFGDGSGIVVWVGGQGQIWDPTTGAWTATFTLPGSAAPTAWAGFQNNRVCWYDGTDLTYRVADVGTGAVRTPFGRMDQFDCQAFPSSGASRYKLTGNANMLFYQGARGCIFVPYSDVLGNSVLLQMDWIHDATPWPYNVWKMTANSQLSVKVKGNACEAGAFQTTAANNMSLIPYHALPFFIAPPISQQVAFGDIGAVVGDVTSPVTSWVLWDQGAGSLSYTIARQSAHSTTLYNSSPNGFVRLVGLLTAQNARTAASYYGYTRATYSGANLSSVWNQPFNVGSQTFAVPLSVAAPSPLAAGSVVFNVNGVTYVLDSAGRFYMLIIAQYDTIRHLTLNFTRDPAHS